MRTIIVVVHEDDKKQRTKVKASWEGEDTVYASSTGFAESNVKWWLGSATAKTSRDSALKTKASL